MSRLIRSPASTFLSEDRARDGRARLTLSLKRHQYAVFTSSARFISLIAGRRFGKTVLIIAWLLARMLAGRSRRVWYIAPTYRMARDIAWDIATEVIPHAYVRRRNETRLEITLHNGSRLNLHGAEKPQRLRGRGLSAVALDEYPFLKPEVWSEAVLPSLAVSKGDALLAGTPVGYNYAFDIHAAARTDPDWASYTFTTLQGGYVTRDEVERQRRLLSPRLFRQEYGASFEALSGRVYDYFVDNGLTGDSDGNVAELTDPYETWIRALLSGAPKSSLPAPPPLYVGIDFNVNPMTYVAGVRGGDGSELWVTDAGEVPTSNTEEVAKLLRAKYPDRQIITCPDPSGRKRSTNAPLDLTDHRILRQAGFRVRAPQVAPRVVDRINAVQAMLCDASGRRRLFVDPRAAAPLVKALNGLTYHKTTNHPDEKSPHIHITDALGYLVWCEFNLYISPSWSAKYFPMG